MMKAIVIESFGDIDKLEFKEVPTPKPKNNEVLIKIKYAAVNPVDWKIREGLLKSRFPHEFPLILGWDASGIVEEVGSTVHHLKLGDEVFAYCRKPTIREGTYAEYITFDASKVAKKPINISFAHAAAIPLAALTAWQALFDVAKLGKGQTILIHAGSGGVGSFAIQLAKYAGAKVITTCSEANHAYVKQLGADCCIDYHKENINAMAEAFAKGKLDVVFDTVGGKTLRDSVSLLKPQGFLVSIVDPQVVALTEKTNIQGSYVFVRPDGNELSQIAHLIEDGKLLCPETQEMDLKEAAKALEKSKQGHTRGKIVLKIGT